MSSQIVKEMCVWWHCILRSGAWMGNFTKQQWRFKKSGQIKQMFIVIQWVFTVKKCLII